MQWRIQAASQRPYRCQGSAACITATTLPPELLLTSRLEFEVDSGRGVSAGPSPPTWQRFHDEPRSRRAPSPGRKSFPKPPPNPENGSSSRADGVFGEAQL